MKKIEWCYRQKQGLKLVEPNNDMANSYLEMAQKTIEELKNVTTKIWKTSTTYYSYYYSLYALIMKIGIKSEIHSCTIEFMKKFLQEYYSKENAEMMETAFDLRNKAQYYPQEETDDELLKKTEMKASDFFIKTKEVIINISEEEINKIRKDLENEKRGLK